MLKFVVGRNSLEARNLCWFDMEVSIILLFTVRIKVGIFLDHFIKNRKKIFFKLSPSLCVL